MATRQEIINEYKKCVTDPIHAIESYLETFDLTSNGFVPFNLFDQQKVAIKNYEAERFNILLKYRQAGASAFTAAYLASKGAFADPSKPEKILIVANKLDTAVEFLSKIIGYLKQFPYWVNIAKPDGKFPKESQKHIKLLNNTEYKAVASSPDALRGFTPTYMVLDEAAFIEAGAPFWAACLASISTGGKATLISCVTDDTFIFTDKGIKQVKDFITSCESGYHTINSYSLLGKNHLRNGTTFYNNGLTKTLKISTTYSALESTETHKYWAYKIKDKQYGWYKASELDINDYVSLQYGKDIWGNNDSCKTFKPTKYRIKNIFNPKTITPDIAYLIGLYISEGCVMKNSIKNIGITISCGDNVTEIFNKLKLPYSTTDNLHFHLSSYNLVEFLEYLGFDLSKKAKEKTIPPRLLEMSKKNMAAMMQGIMDGDGWASYSQNKKSLSIGIGLSSKILIDQIRIILNNFGILSWYGEFITPPTKKVQVASKQYRLTATNKHAIKYFKEIGFRLQRKNNIQHLFDENNMKHTGITDNIPNGSQIINEIYHSKKYRGLLKFLRENNVKIDKITINKNKNNSKPTSRQVLIKLLKILNINNDFLNSIISENIIWSPITKITESENNTYDFSLPDNINDLYDFDHSVIYNGFITHNTPNGVDEIYYAQYEGAIEGNNDFKITEMKWYLDPRYSRDLKFIKTTDIIRWMLTPEHERLEEVIDDLPEMNDAQVKIDYYNNLLSLGYKPHSSWYETMCRSMNFNRRSVSQEVEGSFVGSGDNVIEMELIIRQEKENCCEPIRKEYMNDLWIWKDPEEGHRYVAGLDVSRGDAEDSTGFVIIDFDTWEEVLEYKGKMPPDVAATLLTRYAIKYQAFTCIDITGGMGVSTARKLTELNFPTKLLYYDGLSDLELFGGAPEGAIPGINFSAKNNRVLIIQALEEAIRVSGFKIRSLRATNELRKFVYINGKPDHLKGAHDDILMSLGMAIYTANIAFNKLSKSNSQLEAMANSWKKFENTTKPILEQTPDRFNPQTQNYKSPYMPENNYRTGVGKNAYEQFSWLFGVTQKQREEYLKTNNS